MPSALILIYYDMENIFTIDETEVIENFRKQNPTKDDYYDIVGENHPEFYLREIESKRSKWDKDKPESPCPVALNLDEEKFEDDFEGEIDRYATELPFGYQEIDLYDNSKGFDENFEKGKNKKYILIEITQNRKFIIGQPEFIMPSPESKCVIDIDKLEEQNSFLEYIPIDYDTFWGLRFLSFMGYNSDFLLCDERVMFEALLIKFKYFDFRPFYWSKEVMFKEVGIKKDRATKILDKFIALGIVSKELIKTSIENRPMQITYYNLDAEKIMELAPKIYKEREVHNVINQLEKYLTPALNRRNKAITNIMQ